MGRPLRCIPLASIAILLIGAIAAVSRGQAPTTGRSIFDIELPPTRPVRPPTVTIDPGTEPATGPVAPASRPALVWPQPIPKDGAQSAALLRIRRIYHDDYLKKQPADRLALGKRLLADAAATLDDAPARFVLYREARDLGLAAGDAEFALGAVDAMADAFVGVDAQDDSLKVLRTILKDVSTPEAADAFVAACMDLADKSADGDDYDFALRVLAISEPALPKVRQAGLGPAVLERIRELRALKDEYEQVKLATVSLRANPADPDANLVVGRFLCLCKRDWKKGLPMLAQGCDAQLKSLAQSDLADPRDASRQAELAGTWYDLSEKEKPGLVKTALQQRAAVWYDRALPRLEGLAKAEAERRLQSLHEALSHEKLGRLEPGLFAELFDGDNFDRKVKTRVDKQIDFNWSRGPADDGMPADHFTIRWTGYLKAPKPGQYILTSEADDGLRLWIDEKLVIDRWDYRRGGLTDHATVTLTGRHQTIKIEYHETSNWARVKLFWTTPENRGDQVVPGEVLFHTAGKK